MITFETWNPEHHDLEPKECAVDAGNDGLLDRDARVCLSACHAHNGTALMLRHEHDAGMRSGRNGGKFLVLPSPRKILQSLQSFYLRLSIRSVWLSCQIRSLRRRPTLRAPRAAMRWKRRRPGPHRAASPYFESNTPSFAG